MQHSEGQLTTRDGLRLRTQTWRPAGELKAAVVFTHGQGDYSDRYRHVAQAFAARGYAMHAYDLRGHGRSAGPRGHSPSYDALLDDLRRVYEEAVKAHPQSKVFLYGHSMGGPITLNFVVRQRPAAAGALVTSPWLRLAFEPPAWQVILGRLMYRLLPTFSQPSGVDDGTLLTRDLAFYEALIDPGQAHARISARQYFDATEAGTYLREHAAALSLPVLIMVGSEDRLVSPAATRTFFDRVAAADKTLRAYEGLRHELTNEVERESVIHDMLAWLDERV